MIPKHGFGDGETMSDQAKVLRGLIKERQAAPTMSIESPSGHGAHTIAVTSGKGGVGKSNIALNLAIALARLNSSVGLLDANLGLGNIDLLCGLNGYWNLSHVVTGARRLGEVILKGPENVDVIPGASGLIDVADAPPEAQREILRQLVELERQHDYVIIDTGTGIHRSVRQFVTAADIVLVVTTPEPTAIADAYAMVRALSSMAIPTLEVIVNQADSVEQARAIIERLQQTSRVFLHTEVTSAGFVPRDPQVGEAVVGRTPFLCNSPNCPASLAIGQLARRIKNLTEVCSPRGSFFPRFCSEMAEKAA